MGDTPNQIDISLSILSQKQGVAFQDFIDQLEGITSSLSAMASLDPKRAAAANAATSGTFHGSSSVAGDDFAGPVNTHASSGQATKDAHTERESKSLLPVPFYGSRAVGPAADLRRTAGDVVDGEIVHGTSMAPYRAGSRTDLERALYIPPHGTGGGGGGGGRGGWRGKLGDAGDWGRDRYNRRNPIEDKLAGMAWGTVKSNMGANVVGNMVQAWMRNAHDATGEQAAEAGWGRESQYEGGTFDNLAMRGNGAFGMVMPGTSKLFTEAGRKSVTEGAKDWKEAAFSPGISKKESKQMREELYARGWVTGPGRDRMYEGLKDLNQTNPGMDMGLNAEAIDQATRYGTTSVKDFVTELKGIPEAARAAGVNFKDLQQQIIEMGNATQKQGGTFAQGASFAINSASITGMDPRIQQGLSENPFVQSMGMAQTGLLPQQQGLLSPGARVALNYDSAHSLVKMYSGFGDTVKHDDYGGVETVTGRDKGIAMAAQALGVSPEVLKQMERDRSKVSALARLETMTAEQKKQAGLLATGGNEAGAKRLLNDESSSKTDGVTTWGDMKAMMEDQKDAKDADGNPIFSKEVVQSVKDAGRTKKRIFGVDWLAKDNSAKDAANSRIKRYQEEANKVSEKMNEATVGQEVKVGLAPGAERLVKILSIGDKDYGAKDVALSGGKALRNKLPSPLLEGQKLGKRILGDLTG